MLPVMAASLFIAEPVVNFYSNPSEDSSVDSQALYGTEVQLLQQQGGFCKVETDDHQSGWVKRSDLIYRENYASAVERINSLKAHIYGENNVTKHKPLVSLYFGSKVEIVDLTDTRWVKIRLLDLREGWIQKGDLMEDGQISTMEDLIALAHRFIGRPYTWGGASSDGVDCSGFMRLLFAELGKSLPHSAYRQSEMGDEVSLKDIKRGDLLFFANSDRINHVGLYLGNDEFIHSSTAEPKIPGVRIDSLENAYFKNKLKTARRIL